MMMTQNATTPMVTMSKFAPPSRPRFPGSFLRIIQRPGADRAEQKKPRRNNPAGRLGDQPSIIMVFFSGSFLTSCFGMHRLSTPCSSLAVMSASVSPSPT